jgi:D-tagatose-1,6-bisphosphate aldolase subunit GatZ/KbaZ
MKNIGKLGIGPMSKEVVEAAFCYSQEQNEPLMLIATKNQVDYDGGYVNNWTTKAYMDYVKQLKQKYPKAKISVCRDHLGPGFKNDDLSDVYKTIDADIEYGFDLIHVDYCHYKGSRQQLLEESKKAIEYILKKRPEMLLEVGTDENTGAFLEDVSRIGEDMEFFSKIAPLQFFVVQTGTIVKEVNQAGSFNQKFIEKIKPLADKYNVGIKEHNCDYIEAQNLKERKSLVAAVNVAPQFGVVQTALTLQKAFTYGIDPAEFLKAAYQSGKWQKWLHKSNEHNKFLCSLIAGHYVFAGGAYKKLYEKINRHENFRETVIAEVMKNFDIYIKNL